MGGTVSGGSTVLPDFEFSFDSCTKYSLILSLCICFLYFIQEEEKFPPGWWLYGGGECPAVLWEF